jgi:hypothetical protein
VYQRSMRWGGRFERGWRPAPACWRGPVRAAPRRPANPRPPGPARPRAAGGLVPQGHRPRRRARWRADNTGRSDGVATRHGAGKGSRSETPAILARAGEAGQPRGLRIGDEAEGGARAAEPVRARQTSAHNPGACRRVFRLSRDPTSGGH